MWLGYQKNWFFLDSQIDHQRGRAYYACFEIIFSTQLTIEDPLFLFPSL